MFFLRLLICSVLLSFSLSVMGQNKENVSCAILEDLFTQSFFYGELQSVNLTCLDTVILIAPYSLLSDCCGDLLIYVSEAKLSDVGCNSVDSLGKNLLLLVRRYSVLPYPLRWLPDENLMSSFENVFIVNRESIQIGDFVILFLFNFATNTEFRLLYDVSGASPKLLASEIGQY